MDETLHYDWVHNPPERSLICHDILSELPDWFGNDAALKDYVEQVYRLPMICAYADKQPVGFLAIKEHTPQAAELCVMGVLEEYHRKGIGRMLVVMAEHYVMDLGKRFFTVKTLSASHPDRYYQRTRAFYEAMGFVPLEEIPQIWGPDDPCLIMIKAL